MVMCLGQGADLHMAQLMPLPLTISCSIKSILVLPFWCWLTRVVPDKIQEGRKMVLCVCMCTLLSDIFVGYFSNVCAHMVDVTSSEGVLDSLNSLD